MSKMRIEVSVSPALYDFRNIHQHHTTVAIDVLRATTAVCTAFEAGCCEVVPLASLDVLAAYHDKGYRLAAERNGCKVDIRLADGSIVVAQYGNSPTEYMRHDMTGIRLAYSTTNGTVTILRGADANTLMVGAFANLGALCERLRKDGRDIVLLCSGWKQDFCIEDTLVAGAILESLSDVAEPYGDAAFMALSLWHEAKNDVYAYCKRCSHVQRLERLDAHEDIIFSLRQDTCHVVPILHNGTLTL